jgi:hypothetical protein
MLSGLPPELILLLFGTLTDFATATALARASRYFHQIYSSNEASIHERVLAQHPLLQGATTHFFPLARALYIAQAFPLTPISNTARRSNHMLREARTILVAACVMVQDLEGEAMEFKSTLKVWRRYALDVVREAIYELWTGQLARRKPWRKRHREGSVTGKTFVRLLEFGRELGVPTVQMVAPWSEVTVVKAVKLVDDACLFRARVEGRKRVRKGKGFDLAATERD